MSPKKIHEVKDVPKNTFVLKDISAVQTILSTYAFRRPNGGKGKLLTIDEGDNGDDDIPQTLLNRTEDIRGVDTDIPVTDLLFDKSKRAYYFLDMRKVQNKFWGIMIDITANGPLPASIQKPCWWCRHKFNTRPIGCPIRYNPHRTSGTEKERYEEKLKEVNLPTDTNDFFETEGCFCSFPCCKAFILDRRASIKYKESLTLLSMLFSILFSTPSHPVGIFSLGRTKKTHKDHAATQQKPKKYSIVPPTTSTVDEIDFPAAPSWKMLKDYGGHLTIDEFRATFGKLAYDLTVNTRRPYMYSSSQYVAEKKIKLFKGIRD